MARKTPSGQASIQPHLGRLRVRFPRQLFGGKLKVLALGLPDSPKGWLEAERKLRAIQADIDLGGFDYTLDRYKPQYKQDGYAKNIKPEITLLELWLKHLDYKRPTLKESTLDYLHNSVTKLLTKCPVLSPYEALELRRWLFDVTTQGQAKRVLTYTNAAFKWGLKHKLVKGANPFEGMAQELKHQFEIESTPNAFNQREKALILLAFEESKYYKPYIHFVQFLFLTGCRPSEAVGLTWRQIKDDFSTIVFNASIYRTTAGKTIRQKGSKNNKSRNFPCNQELKSLLISLKSEQSQADDLVFLSPEGKTINYGNFSTGAWSKIVDPIKPDTTPYSCRDTFITEQISRGVATTIIGRWVDSSAKTIEKHYFDLSAIDHIVPL